MELTNSATEYIQAGLSVIPTDSVTKEPRVAWKKYQATIASAATVQTWFQNGQGASIAVVCGSVSGHLEMLDFDFEGEQYDQWRAVVEEEAPGLLDCLAVERSQSGGKHVAYRVDEPVPGSMKLATREIEAPGPEEIVVGGKRYKPVRAGDRWVVRVALIETRGQGGYFLCAPSHGYTVEQGSFTNLPVLMSEEREVLISAARSLTEAIGPQTHKTDQTGDAKQNRPGDDYNKKADVRALLERHGWTKSRADGDKEQWRRPGKERGSAATLFEGRTLFVFSTSTPFEAGCSYEPFAVYAHLEHGGDYAAAAKSLAAQGYGEPVRADQTGEEIEDDPKEKKSQRDQLVQIAQVAYLFADPGGVPYAGITTGEVPKTLAVRSRAFRDWLIAQYFGQTGKGPSSQAVVEAVNTISATASCSGAVEEVHIRVAEHQGKVFVDLCDPGWRAVEIGPTGWKIVNAPPVRFRRTPGMLPLPVPVWGGKLSALWTLANVRDEDSQVNILGWLVKCFLPRGAFPVLCLEGEQGTGKSLFSTFLRMLIDPAKTPLRTVPRDERDLMIAANNGWVVGLDNMSSCQTLLSDALCRISTGGGFATRQLYSDDEEVMFHAMRPILINGINRLPSRHDLADRALTITLEAIPEDRRRTETEIREQFARLAPGILGAIFDAVAHGLANESTVKLNRLPRMADFATWATACEGGLGLEAGRFMAAYARNRASLVHGALENDPVASAILSLVEAGSKWVGEPDKLLAELEKIAGEKAVRGKGWPKNTATLGRAIRRMSTFMRQVGVEISVCRDPDPKHRTRRYTIVRKERESSGQSGQPVNNEENQGVRADQIRPDTRPSGQDPVISKPPKSLDVDQMTGTTSKSADSSKPDVHRFVFDLEEEAQP